MNKKYLAILMAAFVTSHVTAGSLDVYGDIKVNGNTVIDAQGNYVGALPNQLEYIVLDDYFNDSGLKKTYKQVMGAGDSAVEGVRIDDLTDDNIHIYTYQYPDINGSMDSFISTETYESESKWITEGHNLYADGSTSGSFYQQVEKRNVLTTPKKIFLGGSYLNAYQTVYNNISCPGNDSGTCDISGGNYTVGDTPSINDVNQIVFVLNKTSYSQGAISYDDCVVMQFGGTSPWTGVYCKGIGIVKGWQTGYSMEILSVNGTLKTSIGQPSVSLRVPKIKK